jgi:ectoine hydroxylase-related dioxygenase (phytanoyl-CoA dioxygenase family)
MLETGTSELLDITNDQYTFHHKKFYSMMDSDNRFKNLYDKFIHEYIKSIFEEEIIYQKYPTFRIHYPNNIAVFEFHKDKDYNHNSNEINFFLPLTDAQDSSAIWIESQKDKKDYKPMNSFYGEIIAFDGANLRHGNRINITNKTRVSFDFRVLCKKYYEEFEIKLTTGLGKKFVVGDYYE